ncbi:MAG: hypothetical protein K2V38_15680 [Gemmataceae bacterium]|nr:hypothetical protein [Gemmataceae bacterium]
MPRYYDEDDEYEDDRDSRDRPRRRPRANSAVPCPECGSRSVRPGPWPWYLGTVGALVCKAVICNDCDHEFDTKKPAANLATRKRNLAIIINGIGFLGIATVIGLLVLWIRYTMGAR